MSSPEHDDVGLPSAEAQLLGAALRGETRERDRVLAKHQADSWPMELVTAAYALVARRWWDERWDRRVVFAFARRFVDQAPGGSGFLVRDVEAMLRAATGELYLAASLADAPRLPELPYALLLALADDLNMGDTEVDPLLAEAAQERAAALAMVEPLEDAVNEPVALRRYRRIHRRYLMDDDVVPRRPEPPREPRPVDAVRGAGGHAGPATRAGRFLRSYLLGIEGPAAGEVSDADRFRIVRSTLSEALWLYLPEDPDLREISALVRGAQAAYPQDVDPMKAEYTVRLIMGETVSLDGMKKRDIYRNGAAMLQVIAEWWQRDQAVLTEVIEDAEKTLARQGNVLAR